MSHTHQIIRRFLATSALALALPFAAQAQQASAPSSDSRPPMNRHQGHHGHHRDHGGKQHDPMRMLRALKLSQAQQDQARALFDAGREAHRKQMDEVQAAREALRQLSLSEQYSTARATELSRDIAQKESALLLARAEQGNKLQQILTPEQRKQLIEISSKKPHAGRRQDPAK